MQVIIGSDHAGVMLKKEIIEFLQNEGYDVLNCGTDSSESVDYPDIAEKVALEVLQKKAPGILICGTGIGISIAANKITGIRAAVCRDAFTARLAREHNDANILAIGARVTGSGLALDTVKAFLEADFQAGRHQRRVEKINILEKK
ncbi:MAG TPA: ribose 5-phosphate isomerase B [Syntrophomonas sp.]|jgi:RpiB/LacA/LacB family sugar-phosphate isomerase|nr:ribose 5-phosphate isomerase B [Syntrophomonas sp.]